ncbi:pyrophosphatase PpaX [Paenibacillus sp. alder61]|uniref:pyrophosphatase PpaX n=1 Tax=Paenibacillus sp. alder61 TaxID=2862948 RepID=UPI001CD24A54|nr:pyrophosphatase PpaX [Paenibacillus sp. alder61]MCA1292369.1 pyrophosphatase PpaX [Paenibacillus sp. alder61]
MINTILFDLDGTIIDTNDLIINTFLHVLEQHFPQQKYTREQIIPHMGLTLEQQMQTFSGREEVTDLVADYRTYNNLHHDTLIREFPRVKEVIAELHERGITMGIVTTKIKPTTIRALDYFDLKEYMSTIVTVQDVTHPKPHPEPVLTALRNLGADPDKTLMVGDSAADIQSAKAAGVKAAGVAWSLKGVDVLKQYNPDYILEDMMDLYGVLGWEPVNK